MLSPELPGEETELAASHEPGKHPGLTVGQGRPHESTKKAASEGQVKQDFTGSQNEP